MSVVHENETSPPPPHPPLHPRPPETLTPRLRQALGIDALHEMGVIHRDIKPENVLVDMAGPGGRVRLADFNAALYVTPGRALAGSEVYSRARVGSEPYIAWETSCGAWYGKAVDWWALGCLVFDMLFGSVSAPAPAFSSRSRSFAPLPCL